MNISVLCGSYSNLSTCINPHVYRAFKLKSVPLMLWMSCFDLVLLCWPDLMDVLFDLWPWPPVLINGCPVDILFWPSRFYGCLVLFVMDVLFWPVDQWMSCFDLPVLTFDLYLWMSRVDSNNIFNLLKQYGHHVALISNLQPLMTSHTNNARANTDD